MPQTLKRESKTSKNELPFFVVGMGRGAHLPLTDASVFVWRQEEPKDGFS